MIVEIPQLQKQIELKPNDNLLAKLSAEKVPIAKSCGGDGVCGTCKIFIEGDLIPAPNSLEKKLIARKSEENCRFACLIQIPQTSKKWVIRCDYW